MSSERFWKYRDHQLISCMSRVIEMFNFHLSKVDSGQEAIWRIVEMERRWSKQQSANSQSQMCQRRLRRLSSMGVNSQRSKEQSVASAMDIQQELEIFLKFEAGEGSGWRSWGGGGRGGLIVSFWSFDFGIAVLESINILRRRR